MHRQIFISLQTTGLDRVGTSIVADHRIIELGCLEYVDRQSTGRTLNLLLQPDRLIEIRAFQVHGISLESLQGQRRFSDVAHMLIEFLLGAELVCHNARFIKAFLEHEFALSGVFGQLIEICDVTDTLTMAQKKFPRQQATLNALCRRLGIDVGHRRYHRALQDAYLIANVYLSMTEKYSHSRFAS